LASACNPSVDSGSKVHDSRRLSARHPPLHTTSDMPESSLQYHSNLLALEVDISKVQTAEPWSGTIYVYRQRKTSIRHPRSFFPSVIIMLFLSVIPIIIAMFFTVAISYNTPTVGLSCRNRNLPRLALFFHCDRTASQIRTRDGQTAPLDSSSERYRYWRWRSAHRCHHLRRHSNSCFCWSNGLMASLVTRYTLRWAWTPNWSRTRKLCIPLSWQSPWRRRWFSSS
jgi:hypothetical protein